MPPKNLPGTVPEPTSPSPTSPFISVSAPLPSGPPSPALPTMSSTPSTKLVVKVDKLAADGNNYLVWKHQLTLILKVRQLWAYVDPSEKMVATLGMLTGVQWEDLT